MAGKAQLSLGVGGLFVPGGIAAQVAVLLASLGVTAAGNAWDAGPAGELGAVARAARRLARLSVSVPVVVVVDDADCLDPSLALALVQGLVCRADGQVLVVAAAAQDSELAAVLTRKPVPELVGRVHRAKADPAMGYADREEMAAGLLPGLPPAAAERIARRTVTFDEVRLIADAGRVTELVPDADTAEVVAAVDAAADAVLERAVPSALAVALAWAGGALYERQAARAVQILDGSNPPEADLRVTRAGQVARLTGPPDPRLRAAVTALPAATRRLLATAVLQEAAALMSLPDAGVAERVVTCQAAHHVRADLPDRAGLAGLQAALARDLEALGDGDAAHDVATTALTDLDAQPPGTPDGAQRQELLTALLRLACARPGSEDDPVVREAVSLAVYGGAAAGIEARLWAAVDLLRRPGRRADGLTLARKVTETIQMRRLPGEQGARWRLTLAFHIGQAGDLSVAQQLLAPLIHSGPQTQQDAAAAVLHAISGPHADTRLQITLLQADLDATPPAADEDLLRLHHALARCHHVLGEYQQALHHGERELPLRRRISGDSHPDTLSARAYIARWTGECGDTSAALRLYRELLTDQTRILGPAHPDTLSTRGDIAGWTGDSGDPTAARRLYRELLKFQTRVLGQGHPDTLTTRGNLAFWTGHCGDTAEALRQYRRLLTDQISALGSDHPDTLITRNNIASWTGRRRDAAAALRLSRELLTDQARILGPGHPDTLTTRGNVAFWTGDSGNPAEALRLYQELLTDQAQLLGPSHPGSLITRNNIARWTGVCGDIAAALRLSRELLKDENRVLGPDHPDTLITRSNIASWTAERGDTTAALGLYQHLLADETRVLGPSHPYTLATRSILAALAGQVPRAGWPPRPGGH